jgi:hypothetical protein
MAMTVLAAQPALADRSLLWNIVNFKCLRHLTKSEAPIPCDSVAFATLDDRQRGVGRPPTPSRHSGSVGGLTDDYGYFAAGVG